MPVPLLAPKSVPASVEEFSRDGATVIVEDFGQGRPFVLLHGIGMGRSTYLELARRLQGRVIALDLPGFGEAPEPDHTPTMEEHADLVAAWLRSRGVRDICAIGHSMGSQVAAELAARHRDLVTALVLLGPTVDDDKRTFPAQAWLLVRDVMSERRLPQMWRGGREYLRGGPHLSRKIRATITHSPEAAYRQIVAPTLVIRGERDGLAPEQWCREIVDLVPNAALVTIAGQGHGTIIGDAAPAATAIATFMEQL